MTFEEFKGHLADLDKREGNVVPMYVSAEQVRPHTFSFEYDSLCLEIVYFSITGTVMQWVDCKDPEDFRHYEPHFIHENIEEWKKFSVNGPAE